MNRGGGGGGAGGGGCGGGVVGGGGDTQWWRPVSRVPCLGFYSRDVNTLRPTLGSFCFGQASACILLWILFTECDCSETNTWQFLF